MSCIWISIIVWFQRILPRKMPFFILSKSANLFKNFTKNLEICQFLPFWNVALTTKNFSVSWLVTRNLAKTVWNFWLSLLGKRFKRLKYAKKHGDNIVTFNGTLFQLVCGNLNSVLLVSVKIEIQSEHQVMCVVCVRRIWRTSYDPSRHYHTTRRSLSITQTLNDRSLVSSA